MSIDIKVDEKHRITSDKYNFILNKVSVAGADAKNAGEEMLHPVSFHQTLEGLLNSWTDKRIRNLNAETFAELKEGVRELKEEQQKLAHQIGLGTCENECTVC